MSSYKFNPATGTMEKVGGETEQPKAQPLPFNPASMMEALEASKPKVLPAPGILDDEEEPIRSFKALSELGTFKIIDETNGTIMAVITGYDLDIKFNMDLLNSTEKVEQLISGIAQLFREILMEKLLQ